MADYLSTFAVGFEDTVAELMAKRLAGVRLTHVWDGLVQYRYDGPARLIEKLPFLRNTFALLRLFTGQELAFDRMVETVGRQRCHYAGGCDSFRVRFSRENTFAGVDGALMARAEQAVSRASGMRPSRGQAQTELWYIIRSEGVGFYAQLLYANADRTAPGALQPTLAYLICSLAATGRDSAVLDPFCGSGSLIRQMRDHLPHGMLYASDTDAAAIAALLAEPLVRPGQGQVCTADARRLDHLDDASIDAVVTDPPWGEYRALPDAAGFYRDLLLSLRRVLRPHGRAVLLTARRQELTAAAAAAGFCIENTIGTLVNGKKAAVFVLSPRPGA